MRRAVLTLAALAVVLCALAAPPARANGTTAGKMMELTVADFPDLCPPGETMRGTITIAVMAEPVPVRRVVTYEVLFETPLGPAVLNDGRIAMRAGATKTLQVNFPVGANAPAGTYRMTIIATCGPDTLVMGHEFYVTEK